MFECAAEQAVELFEESRYIRLKDALELVKRSYHLSKAELARVKIMAENLLTWDYMEPQRAVDVC